MKDWLQAIRTGVVIVAVAVVFILWGYSNFKNGYFAGYKGCSHNSSYEASQGETEHWQINEFL